jgi:hypothetical protein
MKCGNSAFNAQGSRIMKTCVVALEEALRKMKDRIKLSLPPKLLEKLV